MTSFRLVQVILAALLLYGSAWFVRASQDADLRMAAAGNGWMFGQPALAGVLGADNGDNGGDNGDNGGNGSASAASTTNNGNDNGNANANSNGNSNENGNDNNNNGNGNDNVDIFVPPPAQQPSSQNNRQTEPACSTPGQTSTFTSFDGKVLIHVMPSMPRSLRFQILQVIDFLSAPLPPGNIVGLLVYEIRAAYCGTNDPLLDLPGDVNLAIRYNDVEAIGLDETRFVIGKLDLSTGVWSPVERRANDPANNVTTASIGQTGFYAVYEAR